LHKTNAVIEINLAAYGRTHWRCPDKAGETTRKVGARRNRAGRRRRERAVAVPLRHQLRLGNNPTAHEEILRRAIHIRLDAELEYCVGGLVTRGQREIAVEIIETAIRSAQHDILLEAAKLVLTGEPIEVPRLLRDMAERTIRPKPKH
jgi:hypothetical protein